MIEQRNPVAQSVGFRVWDYSSSIGVIMCLLIIGYAALFSWVSILRHQTFGSGAMDMGYTDQVVWNTVHGRPWQFSTYENASIDLPLDKFRRTDTLLAYHVEPLLLPISLLYLIYASPVTLLVLQAVGVALGAWPAFLLAREHLQSSFAGLVFGLTYLLAPAVQGAILSDFHAVSLTASMLLFALYFAHTRRFRAFFVSTVLAMLCREDIALLVAMLGLYLFVSLGKHRLGLLTLLMGLSWFVICAKIILPHFNGLSTSPFLQRLAIFGPTVRESMLSLLKQPALLVKWLSKREILSYVVGLLSSGGFMALFSPFVLGLSAPVLAINIFSNWSWTYSEGAHYSASIIPFFVIASVYGLGFLARRFAHRWHFALPRTVNLLAVAVLMVAGTHHYQVGVSPLARNFDPPRMTAHDRLGHQLMTMIPPGAAISAQSNLYPHLAHREKAYLFPAVNDAEFVFLDVTSPPYPLSVQGLFVETQSLLRSAAFDVLAGQDGYLLLKRRASPGGTGKLPAEFFTFARQSQEDVPHSLRARFGDVLELVGYDYTVLNVVQSQELPATVTTFWRSLRPVDLDYQFSLFFTREDGAIVFGYDQGTATSFWYPPYQWKQGEVVRMETPILNVGRLQDVLIAVVPPGSDSWKAEDRLQVSLLNNEQAQVLENGTLLKAFTFP